ncbi:MAG: hypothetical protein KC561_13250, partial [Myxococcales bacterium]|nr:hypothetical protein [Myxococcales bacterium]
MAEKVASNRLLEHLVQQGLMGEAELRSASALRADESASMVRLLLEANLIREVDLARGLGSYFRYPLVNLSRVRVSKQALERATGEFCQRHQVLPFGIDTTGELLVAIADPTQVTAIDALRFRNGQNVRPYVATVSQLRSAIEFYYFGRQGQVDHRPARTSTRIPIPGATASQPVPTPQEHRTGTLSPDALSSEINTGGFFNDPSRP